ncbi:MAG: type II toxin-antitoxin system VapC family toxin [Myxococcales bacterium]|nr:MAG: type II toxin-antitoxin system VapC family toxin [Myxococcales bacterium]
MKAKSVLVDSHALLWFVFDDPRLSKKAAGVFDDPKIEKVFSMASLWEIATKIALGKLCLGVSFDNFVREVWTESSYPKLGIEAHHIEQYVKLPFHHRDPFDRLLIGQAIVERLAILSADEYFKKYDLEVVW